LTGFELGPRSRRVMLAVHVATSVSWMGAVAAFAAIAAFGAAAPADATSPGLYAALEIMMWVVLVPLAGLSLVSGIVQAVGTQWGLFRHYWVVAKLVLTVGAAALLLLHTRVAAAAAHFALVHDAQLQPLRSQLVFDSVAGLLVLVLIAVLGWVKPRGRLRSQ
jgi:hypothetical protein